jgi:HK97 family phage prohead protease
MTTPIKRPVQLAAGDPRAFKFFTGQVSAFERKDADGKTRKYIAGTASSTVEDRHGDTIDDACQLKMLDQSKNMTMWLNHRYMVPEDVLGTCAKSEIVKANDQAAGACLDLVIECMVDEENPRALKSYNHVKNGTKLAYSIGGYFLDVELKDEDNWWGGFIVHDIDLLEISLVGIPANPRAYTKDWQTDMTAALREQAKTFVEALPPEADRKAARIEFRKSVFGEPDPTSFDPEVEPKEVATSITLGPIIPRLKDLQASAPADDAFRALLGEVIADLMKLDAADGDGDDDDGTLTPEQELRCIEAMKSISKAATHGLCMEGFESIKAAHGQISAMLGDDYDVTDEAQFPGESAGEKSLAAHVQKLEPKAGDVVILRGMAPEKLDEIRPELSSSCEGVVFLTLPEDEAVQSITIESQAAAALAALEATRAELVAIADAITAKTAESETLSSTIAQRTAEGAALETSIATLKTTETELHATIEKLKATSPGRRTAISGGSCNRAASYEPRTDNPQDARKRLDAKLRGDVVDEPALRPA